MLIFVLVISCASLPGSLALDEARQLAPRASDAVADDFFSRAPVITAYDPDHHPERGPLPAEKWAECAYDPDGEVEDDPGDETGRPHSLADRPWLRPTRARVSPHLER